MGSAGNDTELIIGGSTVTLSGGGTLTLSQQLRQLSSSARQRRHRSINSAGNTIQGVGPTRDRQRSLSR